MTYNHVRCVIQRANGLHTADILNPDRKALIAENSELFTKIREHGFTYTWTPRPMIPKQVFNDCFELSKKNMEDLYNKTNYCNGWNNRSKLTMMNAKSNYFFIILDSNASVVGFITYRFIAMDENQAVTPKEYTGKGFGRLLIRLTQMVVSTYNLTKVMCTCIKDNARALSFYYKCGFVPDESDPETINSEPHQNAVYKILKL